MTVRATWQTLLRVGAVGCVLALCECADLGGELESVRIDSVCTLETRLAILVEVFDPDDLTIDMVTATNRREEQCYLESKLRDQRVDAGEPEAAVYSCWEQGGGEYVVRVTSGERTWTKRVEVPVGDCHIAGTKSLTFELE